MKFNADVVKEKYVTLAETLFRLGNVFFLSMESSCDKKVKALIAYFQNLLKQLEIPLKLHKFGLKRSDFAWIITNTKGGSAEANPKDFSPSDLQTILESILS